MRKFTGLIIMAAMLFTLWGCGSESEERSPKTSEDSSQATSSTQQKEIKFSENILFSVNNGAAGSGTIAECTDAEIIVYTDKSVKVFMVDSDYSSIIEIGSVTLSQEDYEELTEIADKEQIYNLEVEDGEANDGSSYHIKLYDENDEELIAKGGYMPVGYDFWKIYNDIKDILEPYDIDEIVDDHRKVL